MAGPTGALADRLVRRAMRTGLRRGLGDGNRLWLAVGAAAVGVRLLRRLTRPGPATVVTETLAPGQTIEVRHVSPAPRR